MRPVSPQHVEEAALNAWPALHTYLHDGWILRLANGYTKRANSVTPLYAGDLPPVEKIRFCEAFYQRHEQRPIFRLLSFRESEALDGLLAQRGYETLDPTSVQALDLDASEWEQSERAYMLPGRGGVESWLRSFHALNPQRRDAATHLKLLTRILGDVCPMVLIVDGRVVACGLGVRDGRYFGVFDVVTDAGARRQGYGAELTRSLLAWGSTVGAELAYLQVMVANAPARNLYAKLGFRELYRYWYRVPPRRGGRR